MFTSNRFVLRLLLPLCLTLLAACSPDTAKAPAAKGGTPVTIEAVTSKAKGFSVGALMSSNTVYVFFDPQCPHCGHLWQASTPLHAKVRFVWIPVAWINPSSLTQGAALLTAAQPAERMQEHETSLLAGTGGISAPSSVPADIEQAIKANTQLLNSFGAESVPYVVAKNAVTGQVEGREGALSTQELAQLLGL